MFQLLFLVFLEKSNQECCPPKSYYPETPIAGVGLSVGKQYFISFLHIQTSLKGNVLHSMLLFPGQERLVPLNPSLNFPELRRFSLEAHGDCRASLEKVKHPSGFTDLPSQVMFWVSYSPPPPPCKHVNCTEDTGGLAFFSGRFKQQLFFSDTISFALGTRMFQRTEEWGWAARRKHKMYLTNITVFSCPPATTALLHSVDLSSP